ncbi:MAG: hypothetical protein A2Y40_00460 [Candidatus Margulisbacteria bacterium GWF2_35_9]|nr:MAG: hypothetical protein A2Y40_00460 [Candidatus Margulisbacteria bacterium GWF2_35_9]
MVEITGDFHHHITKPSSASGVSQNKPYPANFYGDIIKCEDCPSGKICKKIGNYRNSCDPNIKGVTSNDTSMAKCIAATNILLARLLDKMERG